MPFPTTPLLDDFNTGGGQNLTARAGWGATGFYPGEATLATDAGPTYAVGSAGFNSNYWNTSFTDCEMWMLLSTLTSGGSFDLYPRGTGMNVSVSSYYLGWPVTGGWFLNTITAGVSGSNLISGTQALSSGDSIGISCIGTTITVYYKAAAGSWTSLGSVVNSAFSSGVLGFDTGNLQRIDSFGGGAAPLLNAPQFPRHIGPAAVGFGK